MKNGVENVHYKSYINKKINFEDIFVIYFFIFYGKNKHENTLLDIKKALFQKIKIVCPRSKYFNSLFKCMTNWYLTYKK